MRVMKADLFLACLGIGLLLLALTWADALSGAERMGAVREERAGMVRTLMLTDLCIFTEARYTRHPAMADHSAAFQDHPGALEHFPSGSILGPPPHLRGHGLR